jgi:hypothetical protein
MLKALKKAAPYFLQVKPPTLRDIAVIGKDRNPLPRINADKRGSEKADHKE